MKKIILSSTFLFVLFIMMQSCRKEVQQREIIKEIRIDTTIASGSRYQLNLANFGDEGDVARIIEQATNFSVSQIDNETDAFTSIYYYTPAAKSTGTDEVTLSIKHTSQNGQACKDSTLIYINFTIK